MPAKGFNNTKRAMQAKLQEIAATKTEAAVYQILSQGRALADTMTPVHFANLVNSGYAPQITLDRDKVTGKVGYTANYALSVHDASGKLAGIPRPDGLGNYWGPRGEPKFLSKGFEQIKRDIPAILRAAYG